MSITLYTVTFRMSQKSNVNRLGQSQKTLISAAVFRCCRSSRRHTVELTLFFSAKAIRNNNTIILISLTEKNTNDRWSWSSCPYMSFWWRQHVSKCLIHYTTTSNNGIVDEDNWLDGLSSLTIIHRVASTLEIPSTELNTEYKHRKGGGIMHLDGHSSF